MSVTTPIQSARDTGKILKTAGYYMTFISLGLTSSSLGPTLQGLAEHTGSTLGQVSFLFTARSLGYLIGSLRGGRLFDRVAGHYVQVAALLAMAVMLILVPIIPLLWLLALALALLGFAEAMVDVGGNTLLVWVHRDKVGPYMNGLHLFFGIGAFLSPIIIAQAVLLSGDITWAYWALALLLLPVLLFLSRLPSPPVETGARQGHNGNVNVATLALLMFFFFVIVGAEGSFGGWIFSYARAQNLANETVAAYLTSVFWGGLMLGRLVAIPLATRVHPRPMLLIDILGCLVSVGVILLWPASFTATWISAVGFGFFMASVFPNTITLAEGILPINGRITGLFFVGASAGGMFFPWLIGQLFVPFGAPSSMLVIFSSTVAALLVFIVLVLRVKRSH